MNQVEAFLYGKHAKRKIPSGQRDPGWYVGRHRLSRSYLWRWINTGATSSFGTPIAVPVRMSVAWRGGAE